MKDDLFRKSSVDRVSSPEQLNDYIKIANPSVWIVIAAVLVLLAAALVWAIFGAIKTKISVYGVAENGVITCFVADVDGVSAETAVEIADAEGFMLSVADTPVSYDAVAAVYTDEYTLHMLAPAEWSYKVEISANGVADGIVKLDIIKESVTPISFIFN